MTAPHSNNGSNGKHTADDGDYPKGIFAAAHRDPDGFLELIHALDRLLSSSAEQPFLPCTDPCPLCQPALWLADSY